MKTQTPSSFARLVSPAWILAGLALFAPPLAAEDGPPPARRPAAAIEPVALPTPEVRAADLQALKDAVAESARAQEERLLGQARRLSRVAAAVDESEASLKGMADASARLQSALEGLRARLDAVEKRAQSLDEAAGKAAVADQARDVRLDGLAKELAALKAEIVGNRDSLDAGMKQFAATQADLKERGAKLESLSDLLGVMKRDVESNNEELVEVKQALKKLEAAPASGAAENAAWWDEVLRWPYLPAVATTLGAVAIGVAASR